MEQLYYNLSEDQFTNERRILLRILAVLFYLGSVYVLIAKPVFGHRNMPQILAIPPFFIGLVVTGFTIWGRLQRKDLFFLVDYGKIEFRFGIFRAKRHSFKWSKISSLVMPLTQRKIQLNLNDGSSFVINLAYFKQQKSTSIKNHIYKLAIEKEIETTVVKMLPASEFHYENIMKKIRG